MVATPPRQPQRTEHCIDDPLEAALHERDGDQLVDCEEQLGIEDEDELKHDHEREQDMGTEDDHDLGHDHESDNEHHVEDLDVERSANENELNVEKRKRERESASPK